MSTAVKDLGAVSAYAYAVEKGYTGTEAEFAELMADYAEVGQRAEDAAESALNSKTAAQTAATTATNKASEATTAAQTATTKAGEAQTSAQTASSKASEASQSAQTASSKASEASQSAQTASQKATEASKSVSQASGYANTAETAKTAAQTAQTAAETAQGKAETAQEAAENAAESVSASAAQIAQNTSDITELKEGLSDMNTATSADVGKALKVKTVTDGKVTEWEFGEAGGSEGLDDLENAVFDAGNYLDVSQWKSTTNSKVVNNNDGTFTFQTGNYGTTIWESLSEVPVGTYTLLGLPEGFSVISAETSYSSGYIAKNDTGADIEYTNPTAQKLYLIVRLNSSPSAEFTIAPAISYKKLALVENDQGIANAGKALVVNNEGIVEPADIQIDVDGTLTQAGAAADAKAVGDAINAIATFKKVNVTKVLNVSGTLDSSITEIIGFIIPQGIVAKVTISTDIPYKGDKFEVKHVDNPLYTSINDVWSGKQYYDAPVTHEVSYADSFMIALKITLRHIESTSGTITVQIEYDDGVDLSNVDNQAPNKVGENLINPAYIFDHAGVDIFADYIVRFTSDISMVYVPIKSGGTVTFNKSMTRCVIVDGLYDGSYDHNAVMESVSQVTNSADADKYIIAHTATSAFADLIAVNGEYGADYKPYNPIGGYVEEVPDNSYGTIGRYYPDEVKNLKRMDSAQRANRLRFLHVTDTHQSGNNPLYYTDEFTDLSEAEFMTITGDLVNSTIDNDFTVTASAINAMTKPCYICMGNHDVWNDTAESQRYTKYFNQIATHNGVAQDVSYYAVDFATEKVKCIWLDQYELSTGTPTNIMSATQINWLFGQLDDAITNNLHVCIFMHTALTSIDRPENPFFDHTPLSSKALGIGWILDVISAFQTGSSVTFEHNGNSYSHTFSGNGIFVSYFCGHTHWDACGWYKDYNQFAAVCTRLKTTGESYDNVYRGDKLGIACNYVCIDTAQRRLSIIRIGQEITIIGVKRDAFSIEY